MLCFLPAGRRLERCCAGRIADILSLMAKKKSRDITPEEFSELMREIIKRFMIAGLVVAAFGFLIVIALLVWGK